MSRRRCYLYYYYYMSLLMVVVVAMVTSQNESAGSSYGRAFFSTPPIGNQIFLSNNRSGGSGSIVFPNPENVNYNNANSNNRRPTGRRSDVPPRVLKALGEGDLVKVVTEWGGNVKVGGSGGNGGNGGGGGELYLVDVNGNPIHDSRGKKVVVGSATSESNGSKATRISVIGLPGDSDNNSTTRIPPSSKTTNGVGIIGRVQKVEKSWSSAVCRPEEQTVPVHIDVQPHVIHHPRCIRVERCGGCCGSDIYACEPSEVTTVQINVQKFEWDSSIQKLNLVGTEYASVERHTKCGCSCRTKSSDCGPRQTYRESDCLCVCANRRDEELCLSGGSGDEENGQVRIWDPLQCICACREISDCSSGFYFNLSTCTCLPLNNSHNNRQANHQSNHYFSTGRSGNHTKQHKSTRT